MITDTGRSPWARVTSVPFEDVRFTGGLLAERFDTCARVTVAHLRRMFESPEISHVLENFKIAAGEAQGDFDGTVFGDGDFYKWMEAAVYTAARTGDKELLEALEGYVALIARAQQPDGYISTKQIIGERAGNGVRREGDINDFEVYNMGHLFTSACLYYRLTGRDGLLKVAERAAGYLGRMYARAAASGEVKTAVCPSHYMGLVELYRTTGDRKYLDLAKTAVELRDSVREGLDDNQDRLPLREHRKIVGHAVRANYLYAGVADLYMETGEPAYKEVLDAVWRDLVTTKLYITGGCGALYNGASPYGNFFHHQLVHQAYGYAYQLPNVTAYNETCASVGGVLWAWRMFCAEPQARYMDTLERMLLNVDLAGISLDGKRFFYENMLRRAKKLPYELVWGQERTEYITSCCCPPNLARTIAQASEYAYAVDKTGVWTGLYGASEAKFRLESGAELTLEQSTDYPWDGKIVFRVTAGNGRPFTLHVRVPGWAGAGSVAAGGAARALGPGDAGTYIALALTAAAGERVELKLGMRPRLTVGHGLIEEDRGQAAVERGPLVYCVESPDTEAETLEDLLLPSRPHFTERGYDIVGRRVLALELEMLEIRRGETDREALYRELRDYELRPVKVRMIPYFAWDNRGRGEMAVWLPLAWTEERV